MSNGDVLSSGDMDLSVLIDQFYAFIESMPEGQRKSEVKRFVNEHLTKYGTYFEAPASSRADHHCAFTGGLLAHSLNVTNMLLRLEEAIGTGYPREVFITVGLFHDLEKAGWNETPMYTHRGFLNPRKKSMGMSRVIIYDRNKDLLNLGAAGAVAVLSRYVALCPAEIQAIAGHNGLYTYYGMDIKKDEHALTLLLHWADMYSCWIIEKPEPKIQLHEYDVIPKVPRRKSPFTVVREEVDGKAKEEGIES